MPPAYPVSGYRNADARALGNAGFQSATPANDNFGPRAANDNSRRGSVPRGGRAGTARGAFRALGAVASLHPAVRALQAAIRLYTLAELLRRAVAPGLYSNKEGFLHGFVRVCTDPFNEPRQARHVRANPWNCLGGQLGTGNIPMGSPYTLQERQNGTEFRYRYQVVGNGWWASVVTYRPAYPLASMPTHPMAYPWPNVMPFEYPAINPMVDPDALPINTPQPAPEPAPVELLPYLEALNPDQAIWPNSAAGGSARGDTPPGEDRAYELRNRPKQDWKIGDPVSPPQFSTQPADPVGEPVVFVPPAIEVGPGVSVVTPPAHKNEPADTNTRESKHKLLAHHSLVGRIFGGLTEGADFVDALYEALPDWVRKIERRKRHGKDPSFTGKMEVLWKYHKHINVEQAIVNVAMNQIEDMLLGKTMQRINKGFSEAPHFRNRPVGIGFGPTF